MEQPGSGGGGGGGLIREGDWTTKQQTNIMDFIALKQPPPTNGAHASTLNTFSMTREEQERYLLSLLSFGLERVAAEPDRIAQEIRYALKRHHHHIMCLAVS
jgi:hypothetical protein